MPEAPSRLPVAVVDIAQWAITEEGERRRERLVLPQPAKGTPSWEALPEVRNPYSFDNMVAAEQTLPAPVAAGPAIGRIVVRAPAVDGVDLPISRWDLEPLREPFALRGLSLDLVRKELDPQQLRRLRHGAVRAPFLSVPAEAGSQPIARAVLTALPLAENILLEIEHARAPLEPLSWDATTYHRIDPHPVWRDELGNAAGLAAALALRALSTLDRARYAMRHRRSELEGKLFALVASAADDERDRGLRDASSALLGMVKDAGIMADELALSLALACARDPADARADVYRKFLSERAEQEAAFHVVRDDCRETARIASDAASTLTLIEQQAQTRRNEALQRVLTLITAVVLLPGLIAAVFSAKIWVPAHDTVRGTVGLIALMIGFAATTVWLINRRTQTLLVGVGLVGFALALVLWLTS